MLKIKDNVDLKELEKYGFEDNWLYGFSKKICEGRRGQCFILIIQDREILGYSEGADGDGEEAYLDNTLYDMIKDGIVEKVEQ